MNWLEELREETAFLSTSHAAQDEGVHSLISAGTNGFFTTDCNPTGNCPGPTNSCATSNCSGGCTEDCATETLSCAGIC